MRGKDLRAARTDTHEILDANANFARDINARFDSDAHSFFEDFLLREFSVGAS
jgi:hypothetical protein